MKQVTVRLGAAVSSEDVLLWPAPQSDLQFLILRTCAFEPGAEGLALSYLAGAIRGEAKVFLQCEFEPPTNVNEFYSTILSSIFGYTLIRVCKTIFFGKSREDCRGQLRIFSGKTYDDHAGIVGLGDEVRLIAFDPRRPIPKALMTSPDSLDNMGIPLPSAFHVDIVRILGGMGLNEIASPSTLSTLIRFIHELFANTVQHGRPTNELVALHSTRGIALSKINFNPAQLATRRMSSELLEFLGRVAEMQKRQTSLQVVCLSVMDMGDGIQHTLPPKEDETEGERLLRAFRLGESRKNSGAIERGAGLDRVVKVAHRLGARLQIASAGRMIVKDFSLGEDKLPDLSGAVETVLPNHVQGGTSVDLLVPRFAMELDQRALGI
jgi:hypothetical protein